MVPFCLQNPKVFVGVLNICNVSSLSLIPSDQTYLVWKSNIIAVDPGDMDQHVNVSLIPGIRLDVMHVEEVTDGCFILVPASEATFCDDLAEGVQAYAEQKHG